MRKFTVILALLFVVALVMAVLVSSAYANTDEDGACWGQATAVFAQTGVMGAHASQEETPRVGLHNLAIALYDDGNGVLEDDTIQALGAWVAAEEGLSIDACM